MCVYKIREQGKTRRWERSERASHWHGATRRQYLRAALNPPAVSGRLSVGIRPVVRHGIVQGCARVAVQALLGISMPISGIGAQVSAGLHDECISCKS